MSRTETANPGKKKGLNTEMKCFFTENVFKYFISVMADGEIIPTSTLPSTPQETNHHSLKYINIVTRSSPDIIMYPIEIYSVDLKPSMSIAERSVDEKSPSVRAHHHSFVHPTNHPAAPPPPCKSALLSRTFYVTVQ
ncbi:hypothetical protein CBL_04074 [Carabus blaptoides fortunei]